MKHYQILIIGGGTAGITIAAQLKLKDSSLKMAIIEPSDKHYYQPAWTLVGAGTFDFEDTIRKEGDYIPKGVDWIQDKATGIDPETNIVGERCTCPDAGYFSRSYRRIYPFRIYRFVYRGNCNFARI